MDAIGQLNRLKERLEGQLHTTRTELDAVDKALQLLEREQSAEPLAAGDKRFARLGLSDSCRQIVGEEWTTPLEVRNRMLQGGYQSKNKKKANLLNAIYATLKRLAESGTFEAGKKNGKLAFRKKVRTADITATGNE